MYNSKTFTSLLVYGFLVVTMHSTVIGFYGKSDAGKTSLVLRLIRRLNEDGFKVATIKKTDKKIGMDRMGKDTWKHSQAGATVVVLSSPVETDFIVKEKQEISDIVRQITLLGSYDVILVEGADDPNILKVRLGDIEERENTIGYYNENFEEIVKLIKEKSDDNTISNAGKNVYVKVNGKNVPLSFFPSTVIKNTVVGMLGSLKGVDEIKEVELHFRC